MAAVALLPSAMLAARELPRTLLLPPLLSSDRVTSSVPAVHTSLLSTDKYSRPVCGGLKQTCYLLYGAFAAATGSGVKI
jgi:hypothetical protein